MMLFLTGVTVALAPSAIVFVWMPWNDWRYPEHVQGGPHIVPFQ
jgi:hypothetical protein